MSRGNFMNEQLLRKRVDLIAYSMAIAFGLIHVGFLIVFLVGEAYPMAYFNIGSILFYVVMFFLLRKKHHTVFTVATYLEINLHMSLSIILCGWDVGLQIILVGIVILLFFAEYVARSLKLKYVKSVYLAPVSFVAYLGTYIVSLFYAAPYPLPRPIVIALQVSFVIIVFAVLTLILWFFVMTTTQSQKELSEEVVHDKLTGLPNRYYMASYFADIEKKSTSKKYWIAIADIDDFKNINDTYGHLCGDYVLKTISQLMASESAGIEVCRWGGEEFLLVGDEATANPEILLESIRKKVEEYPFEYDGTRMNLTLTIGMSWKMADQSIDEWINEADKHLYYGKENGKNRVCQ